MKRLGLFLISALAFAPVSRAGTASSGGGKAVVCRDSSKKITSAELLDLYDGRVIYGLEITGLGGTLIENIAAVNKKLNRIFEGFMAFERESLVFKAWEDLRLLPEGARVKWVDDAAEVSLPDPTNCALEQLAYYQDNQVLLVDREIWSALNHVNQAALFAHEAVYRLERSLTDAQNSRHARKMVAHLFSDFDFVPVMAGIPDSALECWANPEGQSRKLSPSYWFYLYPSATDREIKLAQFAIVGNTLAYHKVGDAIPRWPATQGASSRLELVSPLEAKVPLSLRREEAGTRYYLTDESGWIRNLIDCHRRADTGGPLLFTSIPRNPIIISADTQAPTSDGEKVRIAAPWFSARYRLRSEKTVTVTGFVTTVIASDGSKKAFRGRVAPVEVNSAHPFEGPIVYHGGLPKADSFGYHVEVELLGWYGGKAAKGKPLDVRMSFMTQ